MHDAILTKEQKQLLPLAGSFYTQFGLVGGTAIALHIGHRQSIDFDLFSLQEFDNMGIRKKIVGNGHTIERTLVNAEGEFTCIVDGVQFTFCHYPFALDFSENYRNVFRMPDLLALAAMKIYTFGRRAKWKDYVDIYFILNQYHSLKAVIDKAKEIFGNEFNERIFREQLAYFDDINYDEAVNFLPGFEVDDETVKRQLVEFSLMEE